MRVSRSIDLSHGGVMNLLDLFGALPESESGGRGTCLRTARGLFAPSLLRASSSSASRR